MVTAAYLLRCMVGLACSTRCKQGRRSDGDLQFIHAAACIHSQVKQTTAIAPIDEKSSLAVLFGILSVTGAKSDGGARKSAGRLPPVSCRCTEI